MTIEERFESLEKQNRNLKRWMAGIGAIALAGFVGGTVVSVRAWTAAIEPTIITTRGITLKDANNKARLQLTGADGSVSAYDANGKMRVRLDSSGYVTSYDANGKVRARLSPDGYVFALDSNGNTRVILSGADNKINFRNASGQTVKTLP